MGAGGLERVGCRRREETSQKRTILTIYSMTKRTKTQATNIYAADEADLVDLPPPNRPPPFYIPKGLPEPLHDLDTRLGRAYERYMAFEEKEYTSSSARLKGLYSTCGEGDKYDRLIKVCDNRLDAILEIKRALLYELSLAKKAEGQRGPIFKKPKRTVEDWDEILGS